MYRNIRIAADTIHTAFWIILWNSARRLLCKNKIGVNTDPFYKWLRLCGIPGYKTFHACCHLSSACRRFLCGAPQNVRPIYGEHVRLSTPSQNETPETIRRLENKEDIRTGCSASSPALLARNLKTYRYALERHQRFSRRNPFRVGTWEPITPSQSKH